MSSSVIPFSKDAQLPAYLQQKTANVDVNKDVVTAAQYPHLSIKGKRFTIVRDGLKTVLMKPGTDDEVAQTIEITVLRANANARVFYDLEYDPENSEGQMPACYSMDNVAPSAQAPKKQAEKCALCPHSVWGSGKQGKGRACSDQVRLAVSTTDKLDDPYLLRVPPASIKPFKEAVKIAKQRQVPYNALVMRVGFDIEAESPKLTFKPVGLLTDEAYAQATKLYDSELVRAVVGVAEEVAAQPAPKENADELDAAIAARAQTPAPAPKPAPAPAKPKPAQAAKPAAKVEPSPPAKPTEDGNDLMSDLESMLAGLKDD